MDDLHELIDIFTRTNNYEQMQKLFEELFTNGRSMTSRSGGDC
jgi:hypothetical protein